MVLDWGEIFAVLTGWTLYAWLGVGVFLWWLVASLAANGFFSQGSHPYRAARSGLILGVFTAVVVVALAAWLGFRDVWTAVVAGALLLVITTLASMLFCRMSTAKEI